MKSEASTRAQEEFGRAKLGDVRNERRLLDMVVRVANRSSGKVSEVFDKPAELQGAYDFLENERVRAADIAMAIASKTAERCREHSYVFMPEDGSSITLTDRLKSKELGPIGASTAKARGLKMINCIAISPDGVPLGLLAQKWWVRDDTPIGKKKTHAKRKTEQKETQHWLDAEQYARDIFAAAQIKTRIWTQKDREADSWPQILDALTHETTQWTTIRASWNRRLETGNTQEESVYLWPHIDKQEAAGCYKLDVQEGKNRRARVAHMQVRFCKVTLDLCDKRTDKRVPAEIYVVCTEEIGTTPQGEEPIRWRLLTTYPVLSLLDASLVIDGYAKRWLVEQFHKGWKSGQCNVEDTQLRSAEAIMKWATILAADAMRLQRIVYFARTQPQAPASVELSLDEIQAATVLQYDSKKPRKHIDPATVTISQAVEWIARLGGYTGRSSGGPPGMIVIARGLRDIAVAVRTIIQMRTMTAVPGV